MIAKSTVLLPRILVREKNQAGWIDGRRVLNMFDTGFLEEYVCDRRYLKVRINLIKNESKFKEWV